MKLKTMTLFTLLLSFACVLLRTATLLYATESTTGFFAERLIPVGVLLSIIILVLACVGLVFGFSVKEKATENFSLSHLSGTFSVVLGVMLIAYSLGFGSHACSVLWQKVMEVLTGFISGVWFIIFGLSPFTKIKLPLITSAIPCVHWIFRLVVVFGTFSTNALVAEHIFTLCALCFAVGYMLFFGRIVSKSATKRSLLFFFPVTACTFILNATSSVSRLIVTLVGKAEKIHGEVPLDLVGIAFCVFIILIVFDICKEVKVSEEKQ